MSAGRVFHQPRPCVCLSQIQDILVGDKQLAKEIEFDMKRLSEEEARRGSAGEEPPPSAGPHLPTTTPRNRHLQSVLVEAIRSAHRMSANRAAAAEDEPRGADTEQPPEEGAEQRADGGSPELAAPAPTAAPARESPPPGLETPTRDLRDMLRAISTPQNGPAPPDLTFVDRDVSAILRLSPIVEVSRPPPGVPETPSGGGGDGERRRPVRRGLGRQLASEAIPEGEEKETDT